MVMFTIEYYKAKRSDVIKNQRISKIPQEFTEVKPEAYKPKEVTIGPFNATVEPDFANNVKALYLGEFMENFIT